MTAAAAAAERAAETPLAGFPDEIFLRAIQLRMPLNVVEERTVPPGCARLIDHRPAAPRLTLMHAPCAGGGREAEKIRAAAAGALLDMVRREAAAFFPPVLRDLALGIGAPPPSRVRIGAQRTRWASRSTSGTVSCNALLMFLPRDLVAHIMLHELSHVAHMNHGPEFHALLASLDPLSRPHEKALRHAVANYIPAIFHGL